SGMILGWTLQTAPEDVYRALMEGAAFGTLEIIRSFESAGAPVESIRACGGIAARSPLMMQILADITGRRIEVAGSARASALGAAIFGAVAAGAAAGGFDSVPEAVGRLCSTHADAY